MGKPWQMESEFSQFSKVYSKYFFRAKNGNITEKVIKLDPCPKPAFYVFWLVQLNITMMLVGAMVATLFDKWGIVKTKRSKGDPRMEVCISIFSGLKQKILR